MWRTRFAIPSCAFVLLLFFALQSFAQVSVTTSRNNNSRDGQNNSETILTPSNVNASKFGKLFTHYVDGYVYGQPLYVPNVTINGVKHNVIYVVSEHDTVFAFDADDAHGTNAKPLWYTPFSHPPNVLPVASRLVGCIDLIPEIGITSTPVIDTVTGTMYLVAKTKEGSNVVQRLHALDITTGMERANSPIEIKANAKGNGSGSNHGLITFGPLRANQRAGLLLQNGNIFITWASHCDIGPYQGWVISYDENTLAQTGVWNAVPNGSDGGIWQSGTGIAGDGKNLFLATGNGDFDGLTNFGDTVTKLTSKATSLQIKVTDSFTPYNQQMLDNDDEDLGSGGVLLLPDQAEGPIKHLLLVAGKQGSIYLVDRDSMGGYNSTNNNQIVQDLENAVGGVFSTPAFWNNNVYISGAADNLRQFTFDPKAGMLSNVSVAQTSTLFKFPGSVPSISSNGNTNGIVWTLETGAFGHGGSVILHAYDATNVANELYNSTQNPNDDAGPAVKFTVPTIANGKVYVGAVKRLTVYGLLDDKR
jgi:hypothetical protein